MKKYTIIMCASAALLASCAKEFNPESVTDKQVTVTAFTDAKSKVQISDNEGGGKKLLWESGDAISLFFNSGQNGGNKFTTEEAGAVASFTGTISAISGSLEPIGGKSYFWGLYPYNSAASCDGTAVTTTLRHNQVSPIGQVQEHLLVNVGRSENLSIYFRNTLAIVGFCVKYNWITSLTFSGNNDEYVAGEYKISFDDAGKVVCTPTANAVKRITVTPEGGGHFTPYEDHIYYFAFIPGTFSKGYTLKFTTTDGKTGTYTSSNPVTFEKAYYTMTYKDNYLSFDFETVDLGLNVNWATCNLGAINPEESGLYYQWADTKGHGNSGDYYQYVNNIGDADVDTYNFDRPSYKWWTTKNGTLTKYNNATSDFGTVDYLWEMESEDDAVCNASGGACHIPYANDWNELKSNCTWIWTTLNGVKGYKVQSRKAGYTDKWIFLPATGSRYQTNLNGYGTKGCYWTRDYCTGYDEEDPVTERPIDARYMYIDSSSSGIGSYGREVGLTIRPVRNK